MTFCVVGIDHRRAPLVVREQVFWARAQAMTRAQAILDAGLAKGVIVLSTCARTEIYADGATPSALRDLLISEGKHLAPYVWMREGEDAVEHLFSLVSGVDSPVFGDYDVLRQVKEAYGLARQAETTTPYLGRVFERALAVGRHVRTALCFSGGKDVTVAVRAVDLAVQEYGNLAHRKIGVLGAGVVAQALVAELRQIGATCIIVSSRTFERAKVLAREHGCRAVSFDQLGALIGQMDIIFSATASPRPLVKTSFFRMHMPYSREIAIFDLAVPRDFEESVASCPGVSLYTVDHIRSEISRSSLSQALALTKVKAQEFMKREGGMLRVGTRPSPLAFIQAQEAIRFLREAGIRNEITVVPIHSDGDLDKVTPLPSLEGKDFFTGRLESALRDHRIDFAIHSAKDLEDNIPSDLSVVVLTPSISSYECLVTRENYQLATLPQGSVVGTSSRRRADSIRSYRRDLVVKNIRGTIEERLAQLDQGDYDALIMAEAALLRLGLQQRIAEVFSVETMPPHPLQGRLAIQMRGDDGRFLGLAVQEKSLMVNVERGKS